MLFCDERLILVGRPIRIFFVLALITFVMAAEAPAALRFRLHPRTKEICYIGSHTRGGNSQFTQVAASMRETPNGYALF